MTKRVQRNIALILLLVYVPLAAWLGVDHHHDFVVGTIHTDGIHITKCPNPHVKIMGGFCYVCHFHNTQLTHTETSVNLPLHLLSYLLPVTSLFRVEQVHIPHGIRAPPFTA